MNKIWEFFEKIYCIHLPEDVKKQKEANKEFTQLDIINKINWISATKPPKNFKMSNYH